MRIAAIDLGSNSVHMVIVEVSRSGGFQVIGREKQMVRLGQRTLSRGRLPASAMARGLGALAQYKRLAEHNQVEKIVAVATSAVREASNGEDFLRRVGHETGIWPRAISGEEEARLIYLAALHSVHLEGRRALVIDIGGGSVELALGSGQNLEWLASEHLGVLRMSEQFVDSDPLSSRDEARLVKHVEATAWIHTQRVREAGFETAIGTSGTILALGALAETRATGRAPEAQHHASVRADALHALRKWLVGTDQRTRLRTPGLDAGRADIIVAGAVVLDTLLQRLGVRELVLCEWALREGIILDYIHSHPKALARAETYPDVRQRSVIALAERCRHDRAHAQQVARLALLLFDATRVRHGLAAADRALLEYAALLHDIGHHIAYVGHHKHAYYLIKNGDLRGFTPLELEVLACVARYHRQGPPRRKHPGYGTLPARSRRVVDLLAGLLRLADALDRSHRQVVRTLSVRDRGSVLSIRCEVEADSDLELWGAPRRAELLEHLLGVTLKVSAQAPARPAVRVRSGAV